MAPMRPWTRPVSGRGWLPYKIRVQKLLTAAVLGMERIRSGSQRQATATNARGGCKTPVPPDAHAWRPCFDYLQHHGSQTSRSVVAVRSCNCTYLATEHRYRVDMSNMLQRYHRRHSSLGEGRRSFFAQRLFILCLAPASRPDSRLLRAYVRSGPS
jgi:hypothetical protein